MRTLIILLRLSKKRLKNQWFSGRHNRHKTTYFKKIKLLAMKTLLTFITILLPITLNAQDMNGTYKEGIDSITFTKNRVAFSVKGNDGLGVVFTGEGTYEMLDNYILINTDEYSGKKTRIEMKPSEKKDTIQVQIFDENGYSLKGIRAEFLNKKNKPIGLSVTNEHGIVLYGANPKITGIKVVDLLYDKATFDFEEDTDYTVHLVKNRVLEDKTVVFKVIDKSDEKLTMKLLSTDFDKKNPSVSHLNKLDKKTKATIDRARSFEKPLY